MKKLLSGILIFVLLATAVSAAIEIVEPQVTINADYNLFRDRDQTTIAVNGQLTLRNTDPAAAATVQVSISGLPSGYTLNAISNQTVNANSAITVPFTLNVPHTQNSGNTSIGTITASVSGTAQDTASLTQSTKSMLQFDEVTAEYMDKDGKAQDDDFGTNEQAMKLRDPVRPGTEVKLTFRLENFFDRDYNDRKSTLENVQLTLNVDDDDLYKTDVDEDYDLEDIDAEKNGQLTVTFTVDEEADDKEYTFDITIEAEDGKNVRHRLDRTLVLKVERAKNDVRISKTILTPETVEACPGTTASLQVEVKNFGTKSQSAAAFAVFNQQLGVNQKFQNLVLNEFDDDDDTITKTVSVDVAGKKAGTYPLDVIAFIRGDEQMDSQRMDLVVEACPKAEEPAPVAAPAALPTEEQPPAGEEESAAAGTAPALTAPGAQLAPPTGTTATPTPLSSATVVETVENPYSRQDFLLGMTLVAIVMVVALIVVFLVMLIR